MPRINYNTGQLEYTGEDNAIAQRTEANAASMRDLQAAQAEALRRGTGPSPGDELLKQAQAEKLGREAEKIRMSYKNGGPVIKGEFKHANPTYAKFGKTGDSSLLAKGRK